MPRQMASLIALLTGQLDRLRHFRGKSRPKVILNDPGHTVVKTTLALICFGNKYIIR